MTRTIILLAVAGLLCACAQYREPQANCFNFVSPGPTSPDCSFEPLHGANFGDEVDD